MDMALYWLGVVVAAIGSAGVVAALAIWSANQILEATRFGRLIVQWYGEKLTKERAARRAGA